MSQFLFLYGTLMLDRQNETVKGLNVPMTLVGPATIRGRLYDCAHYPGCALCDDAGDAAVVHGQLVELPDDAEALARLDWYEDYRPDDPTGSLFRRERCVATLDDGRAVEAWVYVYNRDLTPHRLIPDGRWKGPSAWHGP